MPFYNFTKYTLIWSYLSFNLKNYFFLNISLAYQIWNLARNFVRQIYANNFQYFFHTLKPFTLIPILIFLL
jgi:hypothetical protein